MNRTSFERLRTVARTGRRLLSAFVVAALVSTPSSGQPPIDPDPFQLIQNETSLALIPGPVGGQPALLAVAYNNNPTGNTGLGVATSIDAGATWMTQVVPMPLDPGGSSLFMTDAFDPAADFDLQGDLYVAQISTLFGWPGASGLFVTRYNPPSGTWFPPATVSYDPAATGMPDPFYRFNDKCHLTVDRDLLGMSPFANRIHVTWIKDGGASIGPWSDIFFAYSTNQGVAWSYPGGSAVPVPINDVPYVPLGNPPFDMANGPNVAVSPTGTVYVAWTQMDVTIPQSAGAIRLDRSYDGGVTWGTDITVQPGLLCCPANLTSALGADARARSFPCLTVSPLLNPQGLHDLYLVYPADPDGAGPDEADVFFTRSADDGATWSPPLRVNPDPTPFDQFQPWVRVKPNGWIDIAWYDRRNDPMDTMWEVVMTRSADRGMTFAPEVFLTVPGPFPTPHMTWGERWMGEYLGLGVDQTHAYVAFTTSMPDTAGDIYFASVHNFAMSTAAPELPGAECGTALQLECPNPYRPEAAIRLTLPAPGRARLTIHDALGRLVTVLEDGERTAGQHVVTWDARDRRGEVVAAGVYFLRLEAEGGRVTEKIALLR